MPPGSFATISLGDNVLSPGEETALFNIASVDARKDGIVLFIASEFSGASAGSNAYGANDVREWVGSNMPDSSVPALMLRKNRGPSVA